MMKRHAKAGPHPAYRSIAQTGRQVVDLLLPLSCAGCGLYGPRLCEKCWLEWQVRALRVEHHVPALTGTGLPLWASAFYDSAVRGTILSIKERGRVDILNLIMNAAMRTSQRMGPALANVLQLRDLPPRICVVPVPSRTGWISGREVELPRLFAGHLVESLPRWGLRVAVSDMLVHRRLTRDQVGLGRTQRIANRSGSMRIRSRGIRVPCVPLLVVDDVVTTGATLREAVRELTRAGCQVVGGAVIAATARVSPTIR